LFIFTQKEPTFPVEEGLDVHVTTPNLICHPVLLFDKIPLIEQSDTSKASVYSALLYTPRNGK